MIDAGFLHGGWIDRTEQRLWMVISATARPRRSNTQSLNKPLHLRTRGESHLYHTHIRGDVDSRRTHDC
jgi:hypothetical protein